LARIAEPVAFEPGEAILRQGQHTPYVYFLIEGGIRIWALIEERSHTLDEREGPTLLGEISFFNGTPPMATVEVAPDRRAVLMRVAYPEFSRVIAEYPQVREALARIGDLRVISSYNGFASFQLFMDSIGWKHTRFPLNHAVWPSLTETLRQTLLPTLAPGDRVLEVGDGPGVVCEYLHEQQPDLLPRLFIQATHLEDAIVNPFQPQPSDFSRTRFLRRQFQHIVALQVFNGLQSEWTREQLRMAQRLLAPGGHLLIIKLPLLQLQQATRRPGHDALFSAVEQAIKRAWPWVLGEHPAVQVGFVDADLDPSMEWHPALVLAARGDLEIPAHLPAEEQAMLEVVLRQAREQLLDADEVHMRWLAGLAGGLGFAVTMQRQNPDHSFFTQILSHP
ncbi:MAG TPA: cyclic nucleotide-binding domain-containing protein, partial [bacterium]|nr:cyclic nucleotide-binding domain-containing protein [bacterium]